MMNLKIVVGSTRPSRAADLVAPWVVKRATEQGSFDVEVLDLRDWILPLFQEHPGSIGDFNDPTYSDPVVREWNHKLKDADALLVVTAEYQHSLPGALKNALDNVFLSWALRNKPLATVGYSGGIAAGARAVEHLAQVAIECEMVPLRNSVLIPNVNSAFNEAGSPNDLMTEIAMTIMLDDLAWWAELLTQGRAVGELRPGNLRARDAMASLPRAS